MSKRLKIWIAVKCAAGVKFFRAIIVVSLIGGGIGAWEGSVPWWWGLACAVGCLIVSWVLALIRGAFYRSATTPFERQGIERLLRGEESGLFDGHDIEAPDNE